MADGTHAALRAELEDERGRLHVQLEQMGYDGGTKSLDYDDGFADSGQVTAERGEVEALAGSLLETLHDIDEALTKFEAGTYGVCEGCAQPIAEARLEAMPAARLCMACASQRR